VSLNADGGVRAMHLVDGASLRVNGDGLALDEPRTVRAVSDVAGRTITLAEPLPEGLDLAGAWLLAGGTGYEIESASGLTITVREYPVQPCEQVVIPMSAWRGTGD